jgi:hypothetical protein
MVAITITYGVLSSLQVENQQQQLWPMLALPFTHSSMVPQFMLYCAVLSTVY